MAWRAEWQTELDTLPAEGKRRTGEQDQQFLALSTAIQQIDLGVQYVNGKPILSDLLRSKICSAYAPSWDGPHEPWEVGFGSLVQSKALLAELTKKRSALQSRLDWALQEPEPVTT